MASLPMVASGGGGDLLDYLDGYTAIQTFNDTCNISNAQSGDIFLSLSTGAAGSNSTITYSGDVEMGLCTGSGTQRWLAAILQATGPNVYIKLTAGTTPKMQTVQFRKS